MTKCSMKALSTQPRIVLIVLIFLIWVGGCAGDKLRAPTRVAILTYNIYHGEDANGNSNLDAVAGIINSLNPDLVALQEVDNKTTRAKGLDLTAELSKRTGLQGVFGKAMDYAGGGYGEAVLSRRPILTACGPGSSRTIAERGEARICRHAPGPCPRPEEPNDAGRPDQGAVRGL